MIMNILPNKHTDSYLQVNNFQASQQKADIFHSTRPVLVYTVRVRQNSIFPLFQHRYFLSCIFPWEVFCSRKGNQCRKSKVCLIKIVATAKQVGVRPYLADAMSVKMLRIEQFIICSIFLNVVFAHQCEQQQHNESGGGGGGWVEDQFQ